MAKNYKATKQVHWTPMVNVENYSLVYQGISTQYNFVVIIMSSQSFIKS